MIIILLTLFFISIYIQDAMADYFYGQKSVDTLTRANMLANLLADDQSRDNIIENINALEFDVDSRAIVTDEEARVLYDSAGQLESTVFMDKDGMISRALKGYDVEERLKYTRLYESDEETGIAAAVPIIRDRTTYGVVYLAVDAGDVDDILGNVRQNLMYIGIFVCLFVGLLSLILADVITVPVSRLTTLIKDISEGRLEERLVVKGRGEIAELGAAFNKMSDKLVLEEEKRRQFVSDASHELKTPLSSMKILVDSMLTMQSLDVQIAQEFLGDINDEIDRLTRIIDNLLNLTKINAAAENDPKLHEVNLSRMIERIVKTLRPLARQKDIRIELEIAKAVKIRADEDSLYEAIYNIVDNAVKYTPEDGLVRISLNHFDNHVFIAIEDNGVGMHADELEKIFERFYRVDKARDRETGGTGLGLAIAREVVRNHGGDIEVTSEEGQGSNFTIRLPYVEADQEDSHV